MKSTMNARGLCVPRRNYRWWRHVTGAQGQAGKGATTTCSRKLATKQGKVPYQRTESAVGRVGGTGLYL